MLSRPPSSARHGDLEALALRRRCGSPPARGSSRTSPSRSAATSSRASSPARRRKAPACRSRPRSRKCPFGPAPPVRTMHDIDVGDAAAGDEGLGAVEHIMVAVAHRAGLEARGIRARVRLGQAIAGEMLPWCRASAGSGGAASSLPKASIIQADHVVDRDIGGGRGAALRQFLEDDRGIEPRQRRAADIVARHRCRRSRAPPPARKVSTGKCLVLVPFARMRHHLAAGEIARGGLEGALLLGEIEIHQAR